MRHWPKESLDVIACAGTQQCLEANLKAGSSHHAQGEASRSAAHQIAPAVLFDVDAATALPSVGGSDWLRLHPRKSSLRIVYIFIEIVFPILGGSALAGNGSVALFQNVYLLL
jgi:hypothetical protein